MKGKNPEPAKFTPVQPAGAEVKVHFNPVSLQYSVSNSLKEEGQGKNKKQFITQTTAKLTLDLVFDTTGDGSDVRLATQQIAAFMDPEQQQGKDVAKVVRFEWGSYKFQGMIESFKETIDFFSPEGVPLRSTVNLSMAQQDKIFAKADTSGAKPPADAIDVPGGASADAAKTAQQAGAPAAGRAVAALNRLESVRFSNGPLTVTGSVQLGGPAAFASGGAGFGAGVSGGFGIGGSISAGVSASEGAFAGLRVSSSPPSFSLDTSAFIPPAPSLSLSAGDGASFKVGGIASEGAAGLRADVGVNADLKARISFEGD